MKPADLGANPAATFRDVVSNGQVQVVAVRNHLSAAIQKLGARNRADAARIAKEKGWL
jgi:two-component system, NarL family, response regulator DesR